MSELLVGRTAVIYGGAGGIGRAVAQAFGRERAHVVVAGRTRGPLEAVAAQIVAGGGSADVAVLDALDEAAVDAHVASLERIDVSFNLITRGDVQGRPLIELGADELLRAVDTGLRTNFLTARAAARRMTAQGSGVVLHLNSASGGVASPGMGSTGPADAAVETFMRYLAAEIGPAGVRVCGIWTAGVAETLTAENLRAVGGPETPSPEQVIEMIGAMAALRRAPAVADVANTAVFLASDLAAGITGTMTNVTCGLVLR